MEFGQVAIAQAEGAILAHSVKVGERPFRKGRRLSAIDCTALKAAGIETVFAARLGTDDVHEDEAAGLIARAIAGEGTVAQQAFTGRANLHSGVRGIAVIDAERVRAVNRIDESLTLATASAFSGAEERQLVATVKVIPFAVPRKVLDAALAVIGDKPLVRVARFQKKRVGLVITQVTGGKASLLKKSEDAMRERIEALGGELAKVETCEHTVEAVQSKIGAMAGLDPILLFGASAIVDRGDVIPAAVVAAGGEVIHLGMPVDPGNLLMLGRKGDVPVIGVPSCARSPKTNGFDWVLERAMANIPVTREDIMDMGAGGLLTEIASRPSPREAARAPKLGAIVLAAGLSKRMGSNKLLMDFGGIPMVRATVSRIAADDILVVTGRNGASVEAALTGYRTMHNRLFAKGLATSLAAGLAALEPDVDAAFVCLGDMPLVTPETFGRLAAAFNPGEGRSICVPTYKGQQGNPVLIGRQHFEAVSKIEGDRGAKSLFASLETTEVPVEDEGILLDADTPEALAKLRATASL